MRLIKVADTQLYTEFNVILTLKQWTELIKTIQEMEQVIKPKSQATLYDHLTLYYSDQLSTMRKIEKQYHCSMNLYRAIEIF